MKIKNILLTTLFAAGCVLASAQEVEERTEIDYTFEPHWYATAHIGGQYTLGEIDFSKLLSPNAQLGVGYQFTRLWGARLTLNAWQSKAGSEFMFYRGSRPPLSLDPHWTWNYINPTIDATFDLTNAYYGLCGYTPFRKLHVGVFGGVGANFAWNNDEAKEKRDVIENLKKQGTISGGKDVTYLRYLWEGHRNSMTFQLGANVDYRLNDVWSVNAEFAANALSDRYNSKMAGNKTADWYFNALVGVKYNLGKSYQRHERKIRPEIIYRDRVVTVHDTIYIQVEKTLDEQEPMRRDIFFLIRGSQISTEQMVKVEDIVGYMQRYPRAKVTVTGYADKGTGNANLNVKYARNRALAVAEELRKMGVDSNRIIVDSKGDKEQPYETNELNRVTICIAQ